MNTFRRRCGQFVVEFLFTHGLDNVLDELSQPEMCVHGICLEYRRGSSYFDTVYFDNAITEVQLGGRKQH